jgi:hypothetical protein
MSSIREYILSQPLFSTHDHQRGFTVWEERKQSVTYQQLFSYAYADLVSAAGRAADPGTPFTDAQFAQFWPAVQTTGYGQASRLAARKILGMEMDAGNSAAVTRALQDFCRGKTGEQIYGELFRLANVRWDVNDIWWQRKISGDILSGKEHPEFIQHTLRCDDDKLFVVSTAAELQAYEPEYKCCIRGLGDLELMIQNYIQQSKALGHLVALKSAVAYLRPLDFQAPDRTAAESCLQSMMLGQEGNRRPLHDYLFHFFVQQGREFDLPVQIHTGYLAREWGDFRNGDPAPLVPLLQTYRDIRFDLFHAGWPFSSVITALGKAFPNVWLDLCWAWAMNPVRAAQTLEEWLAAVPSNKIFLFGADTEDPFTMVGYAEQARQGLTLVLERKIAAGEYDRKTAEYLAQRLMFQNAQEFFRM